MSYITQIIPGKFKKQFCTLVFKDNPPLKLHQDIISENHLQEGMELQENAIDSMRKASEIKEALEYALMFLSYRPRSHKEMYQRLKQKGFSDDVVDESLNELQERRLIDDAQFARELTISRFKNSRWGRHRVRQELIHKGLSSNAAELAVHAAESENSEEFLDEEERAYQLLAKRRAQIRPSEESHALYRRLFGYLARRGFSQDTIEKAMNRAKKEI